MLSALQTAIDELNSNGREDAEWIIYLLSAAQLPNGGVAAILNQAQVASNYNITINTISFSVFFNLFVLQQISQITGGQSVQVPPANGDFSDSLGQMGSITGRPQIVH